MIVFYFLYNKNTDVELIFLRCTKLVYSIWLKNIVHFINKPSQVIQVK